MFNVVTNLENVPDAVLIRGVFPIKGVDIIKQRTSKNKFSWTDGIGPGKVSKILGIHHLHTGLDLLDNKIWIEKGISVKAENIIIDKRIGIDYAEEDALLPYRFMLSRQFVEQNVSG